MSTHSYEQDRSGLAIAGFVMSIVSMILYIPWLDVVIGIVALIFCSMSLSSQRRGFAIAGLVISILAIIGGISLWTGATGEFLHSLRYM